MKIENVKKTGTTTIALTYDGGIVAAADKRATAGTLIAHKVARKISPIDCHAILTISGWVGDAQYLIRLLDSEARLYRMNSGHRMPLKSMATMLSNYLNYYRHYPYMIQLLLAGIDDQGSHIFAIDADGGAIEDRYAASGSGSIVAYGVLEDRFRDKMNKEEAMRLAIRALNAAMSRDCATGDGIDVCYVDESGIHFLSKEEIEDVLKRMRK